MNHRDPSHPSGIQLQLWPEAALAPGRAPAPLRIGGASRTSRAAQDRLDAEFRTLRDDLAAFQQEEMQALQSCITVLVHHGSHDEAGTAHALHCAARQRTRQCLIRLTTWTR